MARMPPKRSQQIGYVLTYAPLPLLGVGILCLLLPQVATIVLVFGILCFGAWLFSRPQQIQVDVTVHHHTEQAPNTVHIIPDHPRTKGLEVWQDANAKD